jgi:hypothetical protein
MSTATVSYFGPALDYQADYQRTTADSSTKPKRERRSNYSRRGTRPAGFNGVHRRRQKRWTW